MGLPPDRKNEGAEGCESVSSSKAQDDNSPDFTVPPTPYFDVSELDEREKNLLVFMSFASYMEWQDKFLESYKEVLMKEAAANSFSDVKVDYSYYKALNELANKQKEMLKPQDEDSGSSDSDDGSDVFVLRQMLRLYRVEVYIKLMLLIFLLKLPRICYGIVTATYLIYLILTIHPVTIPLGALLQWRFIRWLVVFYGWSHRLLRPIIARLRQFIDPSARIREAEQRRQQPTESPSSREEPTPELVNKEDSTQETRAEAVANAETDAGEPERSQRPKVPYYKRAFYQLIVAYILSFLPWWEPNPVYIEEETDS